MFTPISEAVGSNKMLVVVAQLAERSLPMTWVRIQSSATFTYLLLTVCRKDKNKEERGWCWHIKKTFGRTWFPPREF